GSLPPSPPRLQDDAYGQLRIHARVHPIERRRLEARRQALVDALDALDEALATWRRRRQELVTEALVVHDGLWPRLPNRRVSRPPRPDGWPLPPVSASARLLRGVSLRRWGIAVLRRHGRCSLRELWALLLLYGFDI